MVRYIKYSFRHNIPTYSMITKKKYNSNHNNTNIYLKFKRSNT